MVTCILYAVCQQVSVETADDLRKSKRLLRSFDDDDDESTDTINWDGTPSAETGDTCTILRCLSFLKCIKYFQVKSTSSTKFLYNYLL